MRTAFRPILAAMFVATLTLSQVHADEGLWLFHEPPRKLLQEKYHFDLTDAFLERLQKATVRTGRGGSGSFVSPDGLVLTNHHVALRWLEELAVNKKDLIQEGFYAAERKDELPCPNMELRVVWSTADVTARVHGAVKPDMTMAQASRARFAEMAAIEKESRAKTGLESEVTTHYRGAHYRLYRYKKYTDVRLVFAPAKARIEQPSANPASFDTASSEAYITRLFDVCFFRAYEDGKPARTTHHLRFADSLPRTEDLVMTGAKYLVLTGGFPGSTYRLNTTADLENMYGRLYLLAFKSAARELGVLEAFAKENPEHAEMSKSDVAAMTSALSSRSDTLLNLEKHLSARRCQEKTAYAKLLAADKELAARQREASARIEKCLQESENVYRRWRFLEEGGAFRCGMFAFARYLLRKTHEADYVAEPLPERYRHEAVDAWRGSFFSAKPIHKKVEIATLTDSLEVFTNQAGEDADLAAQILHGKTPAERAAELVKGSRLDDLAVRLALLKGGRKMVAESKDPMIVLARLVDARSRQVEWDFDEKVNEPYRRAELVLQLAREKTATGSLYPDGNNTLRLTFGEMLATPHAIGEVTAHKQAPPSWQAAKDRVAASVPMWLKSSADGTYGCSGSPIINRDGKLVGLVAAGSNSSVDTQLAYEGQTQSSGAVCGRGIIEALDKVYLADALVAELGGNRRPKEQVVAQPPLPPAPPPLSAPPAEFFAPKPAESAAKRYKELVPALIKALKDPDGDVIKAAVLALGNIGADAIPAIVEATKSKDKVLRANAALALGKMGSAGQSAIPALLKVLADEEVAVRREAARALASVLAENYSPPPPVITYTPGPLTPPPVPPPPPPN